MCDVGNPCKKKKEDNKHNNKQWQLHFLPPCLLSAPPPPPLSLPLMSATGNGNGQGFTGKTGNLKPGFTMVKVVAEGWGWGWGPKRKEKKRKQKSPSNLSDHQRQNHERTFWSGHVTWLPLQHAHLCVYIQIYVPYICFNTQTHACVLP